MLPILVSIFLLLLGFLTPANAMDSAIVTSFCPYDIWCAKTRGFEPNDPTPISDRPPPDWRKLIHGSALSGSFNEMPPKTSMTIQCTRNINVADIRVTQLEWSWDPAKDNRVWFDVSVVAGTPFFIEGFSVRTDGSTAKPFVTCFGGGRSPGQDGCKGVYSFSDDDKNSMRACLDSANIFLDLCKPPPKSARLHQYSTKDSFARESSKSNGSPII
jgi:hypothetical protein